MEDILVPIFICCVLPVAIVFIVFGASVAQKRINAKVLMEALNHDDNVDVNRLADQLNMKANRNDNPVATLHRRLLHGCVGTLAGLGLSIMIPLVGLPGLPGLSDGQTFLAIVAIVCFCVGIGNLVVYFVTRKKVLGDSADKNECRDN